MYIVAVAWIYVVIVMAVSENSVVAGVLTFTLYGLLPLAVIAMVFRRRAPASDEPADDHVDQQDGADAKPDQ